MEDGLIFLCVAQAEHGQRQPFNFLRDIREKWLQKFRIRECMQARPYDMNPSFQSLLKQKMVPRPWTCVIESTWELNGSMIICLVKLYYSEESTDNLRGVMEKVDDVKGLMLENVGKLQFCLCACVSIHVCEYIHRSHKILLCGFLLAYYSLFPAVNNISYIHTWLPDEPKHRSICCCCCPS